MPGLEGIKKFVNLSVANERLQSELDKKSNQLWDAGCAISRKDAEIRKVKEELAKAEHEKQKMEREHAQELAQMVKNGHDREENLKMKHIIQTEGLLKEVQQLNAALLTRDDESYQGSVFTAAGLPQKPDDKIRDGFLQIKHMVDELSKLRWKQNSTVWTDQLLYRLTSRHAEKLVRRAIVQDSVWCLLFSSVFCSPFRMFGEAGRELEREWNEQCGKDESSREETYRWPAPAIQTERWRYMNMKECREALTMPLSQYDPRARPKTGYKSSLDELNIELKAVLGGMLELTPSDEQLIERLSKRALSLWLDFTMHRCRIRVILTGLENKTMAEKVAMAQRGSLTLTVIPSVGRHGNAEGMELHGFTTIAGCTGDALIIP